MPKKPPTNPRKRPRQRRSLETVKAILDATAHILVEDGSDKLNTNRVAQVAGVSVGSLYQYFPNKEALILAVAERHLTTLMEGFLEMIPRLQKLSLEEANRTFIRTLIENLLRDADLHRAFVTDVVKLGAPMIQKMHKQWEQAVVMALEDRRDEISTDDLELAAFVLVSSVDAVILRALTIANGRVSMERLEEELCRLVMRYLTCR